MAILGARAAERYDAKAARSYFQRAIAAARPQERMQLRRMADASLALAERRPDDLKQAVERLGQAPPSTGSCSSCASWACSRRRPARAACGALRGILMLLAARHRAARRSASASRSSSALPFGGIASRGALLLGFVIVVVALGVLALLGRRRQRRARQGTRGLTLGYRPAPDALPRCGSSA